MRVILKSGEYYDYFKIMRIEILEHNIVKIKGNFSKGTKSKIAQIHYNAIKNIREVNRFLRKEMKLFQADGVCPHCDSLDITTEGQAIYTKKLNKPKARTSYQDDIFGCYTCNYCKKRFQDLKPIDLEIYYK